MVHRSAGLVWPWPEANTTIGVSISITAIATVSGATAVVVIAARMQSDGVTGLSWRGTRSRCDEGCVIGCKLGCGRCCEWAGFGSRLRDC